MNTEELLLMTRRMILTHMRWETEMSLAAIDAPMDQRARVHAMFDRLHAIMQSEIDTPIVDELIEPVISECCARFEEQLRDEQLRLLA